MLFNLRITRYVASEQDATLGSYQSVDVEWSKSTQQAVAVQDGIRVAQIATFDDYPIEIFHDRIEICGVHPDTTYGEWVLTAIGA
jgi:hypothetical protein